jgi:Domain of unknown function (DUF4340)
MSPRTTTILIALAGAVALAATYVVQQRQQQAVAPTAGAALFPDLAAKANDVRRIEISGPKGSFSVTQGDGGNWTLPDKAGYPARLDHVRKAILGLSELRPIEARTDDPALYERIGVTEPGAAGSNAILVRLADQGGAELAALIVGKTKTAGARGEIYVRRPAEARAWLAQGGLDIAADAIAWLDRAVLRLDRRRVASMVIVHPDGDTVRVERKAASDAEFTLANLPKNKAPVTQIDVDALAGALESVILEDVRRAAEVDFSRAVRAVVRTFDGVQVTALAAQHGGKWWLRLAAAVDGPASNAAAAKETAAINQRAGDWAYQVGDYQAKDLTRRLADLVRDKEKEKRK